MQNTPPRYELRCLYPAICKPAGDNATSSQKGHQGASKRVIMMETTSLQAETSDFLSGRNATGQSRLILETRDDLSSSGVKVTEQIY